MDPAERHLEEIALAYRAWHTYDDTGYVEYERPDVASVERLEFSTHFRAPATFTCRFRHGSHGDPFELVRDGDAAIIRRGEREERSESFASATAELAGVSLGIVCTVPNLLMWRDVDGWSIAQLTEPTISSRRPQGSGGSAEALREG